MKNIAFALAALIALAAPAYAQSSPGLATVVATCGTPPSTYAANTNRPVTQNTNGQTCSASSSTPSGTQNVNITEVGGNAVTTTVPVSGTVTATPSVLALTPTNDSLSITTGGTAQQAIAANATRKGCTIQNPGTAADQGISTAENAYVNFGGTAVPASTSFEIPPGASISCSPLGIGTITSSVSVIAATTAHKLIVIEYN